MSNGPSYLANMHLILIHSQGGKLESWANVTALFQVVSRTNVGKESDRL